MITILLSLSQNKNPKDIEKLYNEFFYQAEFILNDKGKIVLVTNDKSLEMLRKAAEKNKFRFDKEKTVYSRKEILRIITLGKI